MQISGLTIAKADLEAIAVSVGQTLTVPYSFNYKVAETTDIQVRAALYRYTAGVLDRSSLAITTEAVTLGKALAFQPYSGEIDIVIGAVGPGLWGLICELPGYNVEQHIDDCIDVAAVPSMWEIIGPLLVLGLMVGMVSMITPKGKSSE